MGKWTKESLQCCKQNLMVNSDGSSEDCKADKRVASKLPSCGVKSGANILPRTGLGPVSHATLWQKTCLRSVLAPKYIIYR